MVDFNLTDYETIIRMTREQVLELHLTPEQISGLQKETRKQGRCGSIQTWDGLPCRRRPKIGWTVCFKHGQNAPQTIQGAHKRLMVILTPALQWLQDEWQQMQEPMCHECGYPVKSLKERRHYGMLLWRLMDRVGLGPGKTLTLQTSQPGESDFFVSEMTVEERGRLRGLLDQVNEIKESVRQRMLKTSGELVVEGEVLKKLSEGGTDDPGEGGIARSGDKDDKDPRHIEDLQRRNEWPNDEG